MHTVLNSAKSYVDWLENNGRLSDINDVLLMSMDSTDCFGLEYSAKDKPEFIDFKKYYFQKMNEGKVKSNISNVDQVIQSMYSNPSLFYEAIGNKNYGSGKYWGFPIFIHITPEKFWECFLKVPNNNKSNILKTLIARYKWFKNSDSSIISELKDLANEQSFWEKLNDYILNEIKNIKMKPSIFWAKVLLNTTIRDVIIILTNFKNIIGKQNEVKT